jgi:dienelactone hydrolase
MVKADINSNRGAVIQSRFPTLTPARKTPSGATNMEIVTLSRRSLLLASGATLTVKGAAPERVTLTAADGVHVYGWHYAAADKRKPAILLFHQAGSNHAEYSTIAPRLVGLGFHCLALDQRSGGAMWTIANLTAAGVGKEVDYLATLPDLEAALAWPKNEGLPAKSIVWGSSYSAALVFLLAAKHPQEIAAVLAFSPGEYLDQPHIVEQAAGRVHIPVFVTSAKDEDEISIARTLSQATHGTQFIPKIAGVHGSSTLRQDRDPKGQAENWEAVEQFLAKV